MSLIMQNLRDLLGKDHPEHLLPRLEKNIEDYLSLLQKWNGAYNLTAIQDKESMFKLHILDSLAILPYIHGQKIIDIGTGAGLPGLIIAMAKQDLAVTLLDSNGKKIRFLQEVKRVLSLNNVNIVQSRAEDYNPEINFDTVLSRAFSNIKNMQEWSRHLLARDGVWLAMKGQIPEAELYDTASTYQIYTYQVPGVIGKRCCIILKNFTAS
jgi:16S rRNA (guanine527-N7)-methyltransferase